MCFMFAHALFGELTEPLLYLPNEPQIVNGRQGLVIDTVVLDTTSYIVDD